MQVFRIVAEKFAYDLKASGRSGRWNLQEEHVIYTSASRSLATLELLVNRASIHQGIFYKVMIIEIPEHTVKIELNDLPSNWRGLQMYPNLQNMGSRWYQSCQQMVLQVPSAVIPQESNYILNTRHKDYSAKVKLLDLEDYFWDERI